MPSRTRQDRPFLAIVLLAMCLGITFKISPALAVEIPEASRKQAQDAAKALASDTFADRYAAKTTLMELGRASIEPLEYAVKSEDPEVRLRAMEILIALRGRGFLGIGLTESNDDGFGAVDEPEEPVDVPSVVAPPVVTANQIVNYKQPPYNAYGVNKPFPAEAAGMQAGDKILTINDRPIHGIKDLMREVITIGPARRAIIMIERGDQRLRLPVLLTRNPMMTRGNDFGGFQMQRDNSPPVDLEKELDGADPEKRAEGEAIQQAAVVAPAGVQIIGGIRAIGGGGQIIVRGGQGHIVIQAGPAPAPAAAPAVDAAKKAEMERLRTDIETLRKKLAADPKAPKEAAVKAEPSGDPVKDIKAEVEALRKEIQDIKK